MKKDIVEVKGVFAFWRYSTYPYVLGGVVDAFDDTDRVRVPSYGNAWFRHIKLAPTKTGQALLEKVKLLEKQREAALSRFNAEWDEKLFAIMPEAFEDKKR